MANSRSEHSGRSGKNSARTDDVDGAPEQIQPGEGALPQLAEYPEAGRKTHPGIVSGALAKSRETLGNFGSGAAERAKDALDRSQQMATGLAQTALEKSGEAISGARDAVGQTASSLM